MKQINIDIGDLLLLETIEKFGSFSGAASHLYLTRSTITQHIKKIEDHVGFDLFDRDHYRARLTPKGSQFLNFGRPLIRNLETFKQDIQVIHQGWEEEFTIAVDEILPLEPLYELISEFRKAAPKVNIRIRREVLNGCWDALIEKRASLVIGATGEPPQDFSCAQRSMGTTEFVFTVSQHHPLLEIPSPLTVQDLEPYPIIVISDTSTVLNIRTLRFPSHHPKLFVPTMEDKIRAQIQGLGVGYLPRSHIQAQLKEKTLVVIPIQNQALRITPLKLAWRDSQNSPSLSWFLNALDSKDIIRKFLGQNS